MSSRKRRAAEKAAVVAAVQPAAAFHVPAWLYVAGAALVSLVAAFLVYAPALNGEFVFDDEYLPFLRLDAQNAPLRAWLGIRPLLMVSYWVNYQQSGTEPLPYHVLNVILHALNAVLVWLVVRRIAGGGTLAVFAGTLFLLHPVNTESVAYVTGRSETLSVFFFLSAWAVFLCRGAGRISWPRTAAVLLLFGAACASKEHTTIFPALLLLTDYFITTPFRLEGIRRNLRLYVPILIGGAAGLAAVWRVLSTAETAGFRLTEFTWYQYLFTQFHVIWRYVLLYVLPVGQNADYDLPVSRTILEPAVIAGLAGLLAVSIAAWRYRRQYPLAAFGWFTFLLLLAPTSSVVPIRDVIAERRLYLPFIGLLLITVDFLRRWRVNTAVLAAVIAVAGFLTWQRSHVWSDPVALWTDSTEKNPRNGRAFFHLAYAHWRGGQCARASENYAKVPALQKPDERLYIDWALALDCENKPDEAIAKLRQAIAIRPSALAWATIGMVLGKRGRSDEALAALEEAHRLDPNFDMVYVYRGNVMLAKGDLNSAISLYRHALNLNPRNETAREALFRATNPARR
jgi:tetratricopeptide (TPR) repeat protein